MKPEEVPGRITVETGNLLRRLAAQVPRDQLIVEIGAFKGRSACFLASGSAEGHGARVVSIDPWNTPGNVSPKAEPGLYTDPDNRADYDNHTRACGVAHLVTAVEGFSQSVPLPTKPIGLLWIDGAHDYESVRRDAQRFCPLVARRGRVVFDDYGAHCRGVDRAVREMIKTVPGWSWNTSIKPLAIGRRQR